MRPVPQHILEAEQLRQWEPEPPPEDILEMSRHDRDMAQMSAFGVGLELTEEEMLSVQLGGLSHDGHGNLVLERRERRKEVVEAIKEQRLNDFKQKIDDLVKQIKGQGEEPKEDA